MTALEHSDNFIEFDKSLLMKGRTNFCQIKEVRKNYPIVWLFVLLRRNKTKYPVVKGELDAISLKGLMEHIIF